MTRTVLRAFERAATGFADVLSWCKTSWRVRYDYRVIGIHFRVASSLSAVAYYKVIEVVRWRRGDVTKSESRSRITMPWNAEATGEE